MPHRRQVITKILSVVLDTIDDEELYKQMYIFILHCIQVNNVLALLV
jgi:hypothetical protein